MANEAGARAYCPPHLRKTVDTRHSLVLGVICSFEYELDATGNRLSVKDQSGRELLGASGTVTTLASLNMGLPQYDRRQVDGSLASTAELVSLSHDLAVKAPDERALIPGIGADRADLVVAGCAILEEILSIWPAERLGIADRGIREGILRCLMDQRL